MSFEVLAIALAHGLAVVLVAAGTHSKFKTRAAAVIAAAVAILVGADRYAPLDLAGAALGYWFAIRTLNKMATKRATATSSGKLQRAPAAHTDRTQEGSSAMLHSQRLESATQQATRARRIGIMIIGALVTIGVISCYFNERKSLAPMAAPTQAQPPSTIAPLPATAVPPNKANAAAPRQARKESPPGPRRTVQECLAISSERAMRECLRNAE